MSKQKLLYSIIFTLLVTALASPMSYDAKLSHTRKGRDLVFALDTSGSMGESGYAQKETNKSKFDTLKDVIADFVSHRFNDNVGISIFGSYAYSSVPLTYDMHSLLFLLDFIEVGIAGESTAIGDGLMQAIGLLSRGSAKNKVIILVTDGYQNSGSNSIKSAVAKAKKLHIKIYTIGIGNKNDFDVALLQRIALDTNAKMFVASGAQALQNISDELNALEPSPIRSANYLNKHMLFTYPLFFAILLLIYLLSKRRNF